MNHSYRRPFSTWGEVRTAYASGIGLREIARNMGIPAGTVLSRAKREGWTRQIATAKLIERPALARELVKADAINAISPMQSAAVSLQERGRRHIERMATISERGVEHGERLDGAGVLDRIEDLDRLDRLARRTFGLGEDGEGNGTGVLLLSQVHISLGRP